MVDLVFFLLGLNADADADAGVDTALDFFMLNSGDGILLNSGDILETNA